MSMGLASAQLMQQVSLSVTRKAMDVAEVQMQGVVDMMRSATPPSPVQRLDIRA